MKDIHSFIDSTIAANTEQNGVLVFPLQCGVGKSSHIRRMIADRLTANVGAIAEEGLIVVTDTIAGLKDLAALPPKDKSFQEYLSGFEDPEQREYISYLNSCRDRIAFLDYETVRTELPKLHGRNSKPIILMTAQRYFSLSPDDIRQLTNGAIKRQTIVFDEKPQFTEQRKITIEELNDINTALHMAIDSNCNQDNKHFLINQWYEITEHIRNLFKWYEDQTPTGKTFSAWHEPQDEIESINAERFLHLVNETYKADIDGYSTIKRKEIRKNINAVFQALAEGATFTSRKRSRRKAVDGSSYENYMLILPSNAELFLDVGARCIVFDGTADISPDYDLDFVQMVDCSDYRPPLDKLTIKIVDINTSKNHLRSSKQLLSAIAQDVHARYGNPVLFCHQEREKDFQRQGFSTIEHFGNIKGRNDWRESDTIVQIGLNRYPDENYLLTTFYNALYTREKKKNGKPKAAVLVRGQSWIDKQTERTRNRTLIADTEQNLFRGAIRDGKPMLFVLYAQAYEVRDATTKQRVENNFVQLVRERYERDGATVEVVDAPEIKINSRKGKTIAQRIVSWYQVQSSGRQFKIKHMLAEVSLSNQEYQQTRRANKGIKRMFDAMQIEGRKGWYMIPVK